MKVVALGLRALPGIAGGVESHCEHLYPLIASAGIDVEILVRSAYAARPTPRHWRGARIRRLFSPRQSGLEVMLHTFLGVLYAAMRRPDILHLHSIGPAVFAPLARLLGLTVVVTHHGSDYERAKWGPIGRLVLKTGERMAMRYANAIISVSQSKAAELAAEYGRQPVTIPNGVPLISSVTSHDVLRELGVRGGRYVLHVGRWTPEKRQDDLIDAFAKARLPDWRLILVGDKDGKNPYSQRIRRMAAQHPEVVLAGFRSGEALQALFANAGCFALPSAVEGFSIALLEALSAGCVVVASDIPANHEIDLPADCYFPVGDIDAMAEAISTIPTNVPPLVWQRLRSRVHEEYDWRKIAEQTIRLYRNCLSGSLEPKKTRNDSRCRSERGN